MRYFPSIRKHLAAAVMVTCLCACAGCTTLLAGAIVFKIVKAVQASKKPHPDENKDILVYAVWVEDPREKMTYLVEVELLQEVNIKEKQLYFTVEKAFVSFQDRKKARISIRDVDGDGYIDEVLIDEMKYGPMVPYASEKYMEAQEKGGLAKEAADFKLEKNRTNPWFSFLLVEKDGSIEKKRRLHVYAFQLKFDSIVISTLQHLDLYKLKISG